MFQRMCRFCTRALQKVASATTTLNCAAGRTDFFAASLAFALLSVLVNSVCTASVMRSMLRSSGHNKFFVWARDHVSILVVVTMLSATNVQALLLLSSRLFYRESFSAPLPAIEQARLLQLGACEVG